MLPIAHRGCWYPDRSKANHPDALLEAAEHQWGFETDVRFCNGGLIIQHDPTDPSYLIDYILPACERAPLICWNLKDVLAEIPLYEWLSGHRLLDKSLVFDVELYDKRGLPRVCATYSPQHVLVRVSEHDTEPIAPALLSPCVGLWLDTWESDWVVESTLLVARNHRKLTYVVSPELHQRPIHLNVWKRLAAADGICTDFPHILETFLKGILDMPADAWWIPPHAR